jgi:hypothetical protein
MRERNYLIVPIYLINFIMSDPLIIPPILNKTEVLLTRGEKSFLRLSVAICA